MRKELTKSQPTNAQVIVGGVVILAGLGVAVYGMKNGNLGIVSMGVLSLVSGLEIVGVKIPDSVVSTVFDNLKLSCSETKLLIH
jgi:hypothetical protein